MNVSLNICTSILFNPNLRKKLVPGAEYRGREEKGRGESKRFWVLEFVVDFKDHFNYLRCSINIINLMLNYLSFYVVVLKIET